MVKSSVKEYWNLLILFKLFFNPSSFKHFRNLCLDQTSNILTECSVALHILWICSSKNSKGWARFWRNLICFGGHFMLVDMFNLCFIDICKKLKLDPSRCNCESFIIEILKTGYLYIFFIFWKEHPWDGRNLFWGGVGAIRLSYKIKLVWVPRSSYFSSRHNPLVANKINNNLFKRLILTNKIQQGGWQWETTDSKG